MNGTCALVVPWHVSGFGYTTVSRAKAMKNVTRKCLMHMKCIVISFLVLAISILTNVILTNRALGGLCWFAIQRLRFTRKSNYSTQRKSTDNLQENTVYRYAL